MKSDDSDSGIWWFAHFLYGVSREEYLPEHFLGFSSPLGAEAGRCFVPVCCQLSKLLYSFEYQESSVIYFLITII